jgi:TonB-linked SusC/RagA family outer membrane protein
MKLSPRRKLPLYLLLFAVSPALAVSPSIRDTIPGKDSSMKNLARQRAMPVQLLTRTTVLPHLTAASTQTIYTDDLTKMPVTSIRNALTGRIAGLATFQMSGRPGADGVNVTLRGAVPLILIDGIPRELTIFDLEEIESVTVLKDALATAMLGVRASNGALLVTTKKGTPGRQRISFTVQTAFQQPLSMPKALHSYDYARLYNEARVNDGLLPVYSDADLEGYKSGKDPFKYPDVDWRKQLLRNTSRFDRYTMNVSGGNDFAKYFVALEHVNQTGFFKTLDSNTYNTNNKFQSYVVRSNVNININKKLNAGINLLGRILNGTEPGSSTDNILTAFLYTPNNAYPVLNPNGSYGGATQFPNNIWAMSTGSGYRQNYQRDMLADVYLKRTLDEITPGMWTRATLSFYATLSENINRSKGYAVYERNVSQGGVESYKQLTTISDQVNSNWIERQSRSSYTEFALGYDHTFSNTHGISATLLLNQDNMVRNSDLSYTIRGGSARVAYNYKERYVAEFVAGLNGSNWYPPTGSFKYGLFPAIGLAWNLNKESFMKEVTWISALKLFGSFGKTGWDDPGYFSYIQRYYDSDPTYFGTGAGSNTSIREQPLANPNISWEKAHKLNVGLQGAFLTNRLGFTVEVFNNKLYDRLMERGKNSAIIGNTYPLENIGRQRYSGLDLQLSWQETKGPVNYYISGNVGVLNNKVLYSDEVFRPYSWMVRTGRMVDQNFGYIAEGLYQSRDEISRSASTEGYVPQPGDIKYRDLNGDGVINQFDQAPIGAQKPFIRYGVNLGVSYKGFDLSALLQGVKNRDIYLGSFFYWEFQNGGLGQAYEHHLDRWTPGNAANASYPRLSLGYNPHNQATSSYWMRSGDYLRLKNLELGYTLPASWTQRVRLQSTRIFASGTNLLTFTSLKDKNIDPEVFYSAYPIQRLWNIGINIQL